MPFKSQQNAVISIPFLLLLSTLVAFGPLSIDLYLPSLPNIAQELQSSDTQIQWTISGFLIGFCVGMLFYGPLSDRYGRKPILLIGIFLYLITSLACYQSSFASQLILFRVLQALGGGAASVLARAMVKDLLPLKQAVRVLSLMHVVTMIAPLLAPLIGGYLMLAFGWRSLFLVLFIFALLCFIAVLFIRETLPKEKRGGSISKAFTAYKHILYDNRALSYILCAGFIFGGMFAYIASSSFVFINYFKVPEQYFGFIFGCNIVGIMIVTFSSGSLSHRISSQTLLKLSTLIALIAGILLLISAYFAIGGMWLIIIFATCYISMTGTIGANCIACLMSLYPTQAGAASALIVATQFGLGFLASIIVSLLTLSVALNMAIVMAVFGIGSFFALRFSH